MGIFIGDNGNNILTGTDGFDLLDGLSGNDTMKGGKGDDTYFVDSSKDRVIEAANAGFDTVSATDSYTLEANVETLLLAGSGDLDGTGNTLGNTINGNTGANKLSGLSGNDTLDGEAGLDLLDGGAGNDVLIDSGDADTLKGGTGNDIYQVISNSSSIVEAAGGGTDEVQADGIGFSLFDLKNVENLTLLGTANSSGTGNALANRITGTIGENLLAGNEGNDTLDGASGVDVMFGGIGNDTYIVDDKDDQAIEGAGGGSKDTVLSAISYALLAGSEVELLTLTGNGNINGTGNEIANLITGNGNSNTLDGDKGNDTLNGGAGDDRLVGGLGKDLLTGGAQNDVYVVDDAGDKVVELAGLATQGRDRVESSLANYTLGANVEDLVLLAGALNGTGNSLANEIEGNGVANKLDGAGGNDQLFGDAGDDTLIGGAGNDELEGELGLDLVDGGAGDDVLLDKFGNDTLKGGTGNDVFIVFANTSAIIEAAGGGIDEVQAIDVTTFSLATLTAVENLRLLGGALNGTGNDLSNVILGNNASNVLDGGKGNDTLDGEQGVDVLKGGLGDDLYIVDDKKDQVIEAVNGGKDTVRASDDFNLSLAPEVEILTLIGDDDLDGSGNALANTITGNTGANNLSGDLGNDTLSGGDGDDSLAGGSGDDSMVGGKGDDSYAVGSAGDKVTELANQGIDTVISNITSYTLGANVEKLRLGDLGINGTGNTLANTLEGNEANNKLDGGAGNDVIDGASGNDLLLGGAGNDTVRGRDGDDDLFGGAGDDVLEGGALGDFLTGGAGKDIFVYGADLDPVSAGIDSITDFTRGADKIDLRDLLEAFDIDLEDAFADGHIVLDTIQGDTSIRFSVEGGGQNLSTLAVADNVALTQADFLL